MPFFGNDMLPLFFLSKPRAVEVTCYQPAKVMAVAPVSTSSIYTTVPGTAVCAFAFVCVCVRVCVCVFWGMLRDLFHPRTPTSQQLCLGHDPELAGTRTETGKNTSLPLWVHCIFFLWNEHSGNKGADIKWVFALLCSALVQPHDLNLKWKKKNLLLRCFKQQSC